jgi:hypothetical protein
MPSNTSALRVAVAALSETELVTILEAARLALMDSDMYAYIADQTDLSDKVLQSLQNKLRSILTPGD